ncbi:hypothetical protein Vadar_005781 [Vaccinium darrowii]|uniref:Uncharacterized protein n=1 Tax=Vaccinium darrowii TaxID=229202 RepID=A0ACB7XXD9_9ERIC|nr:hypothetical protein Vadar_005781 [Vaccinium darrowii]
MAKNDGKDTRYTRYFKAPIRVLTKARDFYVRTMLDWAARGGSASGYCTHAPFYNLPGTFSFDSTRNSIPNEDVKELKRAASARNPSTRVQSEILRRPRCVKLPSAARRSLRRTVSVGIIGRIEEDKACEFGEDVTVETSHVEYGRSGRNCVVSKRADLLSK